MSRLGLKKEMNFFTTSFIFFSLLVFIVSRNNANLGMFFSSAGNGLDGEGFSLQNPLHYLRLFLHILGNNTILQIIANAGFLLFFAPLIEQKYTKGILLGMYFTTALVSASLNIAFFPQPIQGGTGIAFLYLLLALIDAAEKKAFSLTLLLIFVLYVMKTFYTAIDNQDLSGFAHLLAAFIASILAFMQEKKAKKKPPVKKKV